ncbi:MAG: tRNA (adenosine(37)-N6)-threonylcarbamoyltransferase complex dimerization subunit type 1 TsaB [Pirellulaceae bacterium]|nr:tRNA (adenosine(37)-N6)-threonylcarbamoyltransferase complex dimerization subunit type 1 TsaB [Pirellulaceae bacterium]
MTTIWQLAIECSSIGGSAALLCEDEYPAGGAAIGLFPSDRKSSSLHSQTVLPAGQGSVRTLAPAIDQLLRAANLSVANLKFISITNGPGSFTGLRVGLTTAKLLAWAHRLPIVPVDTLHATALRFAQAKVDNKSQSGEPDQLDQPYRLVTAINAFRKQVFTASWLVLGHEVTNVRPACVVDVPEWLSDPWGAQTLSPSVPEEFATTGPTWITGSALAAYPGLDESQWHLAESELWPPMAEQVGQLGWLGFQSGLAVPAAELMPNYIRASAAEEAQRS